MSYEFVCVQWSPSHVLLCFSSSCVPYFADFFGLSFFIASSAIGVYVYHSHHRHRGMTGLDPLEMKTRFSTSIFLCILSD